MTKKIKRIAAINDLSGYGKCSLGIALPVLSAAGYEVCSIPTAIYSTHTVIKDGIYFDTTEMFDDYIRSWINAKVKLNAIYTGFISSKEQIFSTLQLFADYPKALKFVDPAMGDYGKLYSTYNKKTCETMKKLVKHADCIFPNLTEAYILLDKQYNPQPKKDEIKNLLWDLKNLGPNNVILTGVKLKNKIYNWALDKDENIYFVKNDYIKGEFHGSGDLFSSCFISKILKNNNIKHSLKFASNFCENTVKLTITQKDYKKHGVYFESLLKKL